MLKRDSLTAQMQQLSHTLAKVKRLIVERQETEARSVLQDVLDEYFGINMTDLLETQKNLQPEELGLLADYLDVLATLTDDTASRQVIWKRILLLYDTLEQEHKMASFTHLARRSEILKELSQ